MYSVSVETVKSEVDLISMRLFELGAEGVEIKDSQTAKEIMNANTIFWDYCNDNVCLENGNNPVLVAILEIDNLEEFKKEIKHGNEASILSLNIEPYVSVDWLQEWKKYYDIHKVGQFNIVPIWKKDQAEKEDNVNIYIEPSSAFGTGEHQTTKGCLTLMSSIDLKNKKILDVGTGSGILGIASIKAGAKFCKMYDIDESVKTSLMVNLKLNQCENYVEFKVSNLIPASDGIYDIIIANITADPLVELSKTVKKHLNSNGYLVCSGVISTKEILVLNSFEKNGLKCEKIIREGEWVSMLFTVS